MGHPIFKQLPSLRKEIYSLLVGLKKGEDWKRLREEFKQYDVDETPHIQVTIGCTFDMDEGEISWNYQTGDNSYTGGAYGHPEWFTVSITSRSCCKDEARDIVHEMSGRIHELLSH
jgi:hypothetical protein